MKGIKLREGLLFPILIAFLLFSMVAVISVGSASIDMGTVYRILVDQLFFKGKGTEAGLWEKSFYQIDRMEYPSAKSALWCLLRRRPFDLWSCHAGAGTEPHRRTLYFGSFLRSIGRSSLGAADADSFFQGTVSDHGYGSLRRFGGLCLCLQHGEDRSSAPLPWPPVSR